MKAVLLTLFAGATALMSTPCMAQVPAVYMRGYGYVTPYGYDPSVYGPMGYYGPNYFGYYGPTPADRAAQGQAIGAAARGIGEFQKDHEQARWLYQQAYQEYLKTLDLERQYKRKFDAENQEAQQQKIEASKERIAEIKRNMAQRAAPQRLSEDQFNRQTQTIDWPYCLRDGTFDAQRETLDRLFQERSAENSGADSESAKRIQDECLAMYKTIGDNINDFNIDQFITAKHFLASLAYESRFKLK